MMTEATAPAAKAKAVGRKTMSATNVHVVAANTKVAAAVSVSINPADAINTEMKRMTVTSVPAADAVTVATEAAKTAIRGHKLANSRLP